MRLNSSVGLLLLMPMIDNDDARILEAAAGVARLRQPWLCIAPGRFRAPSGLAA